MNVRGTTVSANQKCAENLNRKIGKLEIEIFLEYRILSIRASQRFSVRVPLSVWQRQTCVIIRRKTG